MLLTLFSAFALANSNIDLTYHGVAIGDSFDDALNNLPNDYVSYKDNNSDQNCFFIGLSERKNGVDFMITNGIVSLMYFDSNDKNAPLIKGLGIGSTKKEILKIFPHTKSRDHPWINGEYLSVELESEKGILFEVNNTGIVFEYRFGKMTELFLSEGCS